MKLLDALDIVYDLAEENSLDERIPQFDADLKSEYKKQQEALSIVFHHIDEIRGKSMTVPQRNEENVDLLIDRVFDSMDMKQIEDFIKWELKKLYLTQDDQHDAGICFKDDWERYMGE